MLLQRMWSDVCVGKQISVVRMPGSRGGSVRGSRPACKLLLPAHLPGSRASTTSRQRKIVNLTKSALISSLATLYIPTCQPKPLSADTNILFWSLFMQTPASLRRAEVSSSSPLRYPEAYLCGNDKRSDKYLWSLRQGFSWKGGCWCKYVIKYFECTM